MKGDVPGLPNQKVNSGQIPSHLVQPYLKNCHEASNQDRICFCAFDVGREV